MRYTRDVRQRSGERRRLRQIATVSVSSAIVLATLVAPVWATQTTISVDTLRTAWDQNEPGLAPSSVRASDFGQMFSTQLDGQIYAQPIVSSGTLVIATENNKVYGLNPTSGAITWTKDLGPAWPAATVTCSDLAPNIGVTSTPVVDGATQTVYLTSKANDGADAQHPHYYMHALSVTTGAERAGWPVTIGGSPTNEPSVTFNPMTAMQRPGLLLLDGVVYAGFGSHCDRGPYRGYIVGVSASTPVQTTMWTTESGASNSKAGIWQSGGGLVSDGPGRIIVSTGNGVSPTAGPGNSPPGTLAESVVRLKVNPNNSLQAVDFFSPSNAAALDQSDKDISSGGPVALPDSFGTPSHPHVLVQAGKDGRVFLLDRDNLGGSSQGPGGTDAVVGMVGPYQGQWGHPAVWGGDGGYVYEIGSYGPLRAFKAGVTGDGRPALSMAGTSQATFGYTSGSPVVSSTGSTSGSATVWIMTSTGPTGSGGQLRAFLPTPDAGGLLTQIYAAPIGTASKFAVPLTDNGRVYAGTRDGKVYAFGRPAQTAVTASPVDFGTTSVGSTVSRTAVLTAASALSVTSLTTSAPFALTAPALPAALAAGGTLSVPVSFHPTAAGSASGTLNVVTSKGTVGFSLAGTATSPGLVATPSSLNFPNQPTGTTISLNVQLTNTGTAAETIISTTAPSSPFIASGLPANGTVIAPSGSFVASVTYAPTTATSSSSSLVVRSTSGTWTLPLTGSSISGQGQLVFTPATLDFGSVAVGSARTLSFDITNVGNIPVTITKAKAPLTMFSSADPLPEGLTIPADGVVHQSVTFAPTGVGAQADVYGITSDSGQGPMTELLKGTGSTALPVPGVGVWSFNGAAVMSGSDLVLNPVATSSRGSSFYPSAVPSEGLRATFTAVIGGGTGADGLTLALVDASKAGSASLGAAGNGLGLAGVPGFGVALKTTYTSALSSSNVAGVVSSVSGSTKLTWVSQKALAVALRTGTHVVSVSVTGGHVLVDVDGVRVLDTVVTLPPNVLVGFTGATGAKTDQHAVRNVTITRA